MTQFSEFVKRQQRSAAAADAIDWNKERDDWLRHLQVLYDCILNYLEDYVAIGEVYTHESLQEINEEKIGVYNAKSLKIVIGAQEIRLTPIGTLLIGSKGRVDVEGSAGRSRLVLIDRELTNGRSMVRVSVKALRPGDQSDAAKPPEPPRDTAWTWKIVSAPPSLTFIELNKESFFDMLMEVSNG